MIIQNKYEIGELVDWEKEYETTEYITCPFCNGKNIITGYDGSQKICPVCNGNSNIHMKDTQIYRGVITHIRINYLSSDSKYYFGPIIEYYINNEWVNENNIIEVVDDEYLEDEESVSEI